MKSIYALLSVILFSVSVFAQPNCTKTSVGLILINDLGSGTYNGWTGGLYPNGSNIMPASHMNAGMAHSAQVQPLNSIGDPDLMNGKIVWLSIGFSNTTQEASTFIPLANALPNKNSKLVLIDGAVGGQSTDMISTPTNSGYNTYWNTVNTRLTNAGLSPSQVQVIWFKDDIPANNRPLQAHYDSLLIQSKRIMNEIKTRFPNAQLCYIASRIYAGYASSQLNPEPYAYQNGWTMKKLIEDQINGDPQLQHSGASANSPWLSWGVYQWADGTTPRSDGLTWTCPDDYSNDGTHPSTTGRLKVANLLSNFFQTDTTACSWFLNDCAKATGVTSTYENDVVKIYPSPFTNEITIHSDKPFINSRIAIYNSLGQQIKIIENVSGNNVAVDFRNHTDHLYIVSIISNGNVRSRLVMKE
ncbi:MAG: T9SS type A sorting domain-containing protein [Ignavibacteria bacterium]|nr:T9SS type A sorting domain-containing protein [Ignavibacteria bacterium]